MFQGRGPAPADEATPAKMNNTAIALSARRLNILAPYQIEHELRDTIITPILSKKKRYFIDPGKHSIFSGKVSLSLRSKLFGLSSAKGRKRQAGRKYLKTILMLGIVARWQPGAEDTVSKVDFGLAILNRFY